MALPRSLLTSIPAEIYLRYDTLKMDVNKVGEAYHSLELRNNVEKQL
jgi:hypothetical protein